MLELKISSPSSYLDLELVVLKRWASVFQCCFFFYFFQAWNFLAKKITEQVDKPATEGDAPEATVELPQTELGKERPAPVWAGSIGSSGGWTFRDLSMWRLWIPVSIPAFSSVLPGWAGSLSSLQHNKSIQKKSSFWHFCPISFHYHHYLSPRSLKNHSSILLSFNFRTYLVLFSFKTINSWNDVFMGMSECLYVHWNRSCLFLNRPPSYVLSNLLNLNIEHKTEDCWKSYIVYNWQISGTPANETSVCIPPITFFPVLKHKNTPKLNTSKYKTRHFKGLSFPLLLLGFERQDTWVLGGTLVRALRPPFTCGTGVISQGGGERHPPASPGLQSASGRCRLAHHGGVSVQAAQLIGLQKV